MGRTSGTALPFTNFLPIAPLKTSRQRHLDEMVKKMRQKENHGVTLQVSHFIRLKFFCLFSKYNMQSMIDPFRKFFHKTSASIK
jgi:hypothetical protein